MGGKARPQPQQQQQQLQQQKYADLKLVRKGIESFVTRYYDKDNRSLTLSNLRGLLPKVQSIDFNDKRFTVLLESILAVSCPDIVTLALDNNNISKLPAVAYLLTNRLKIINLSLDSNNISNFDELNHIKNVNLRQLMLSNNPICGQDERTYQMEVVRRLPDLYILDQQQVKLEDNHPNVQLPPLRGSYYDSPEILNLSERFLREYYGAFDGDRNSLVGAYADQAVFSVSHIPTSQPKGRQSQSSFRRDTFAPYATVNRNLTETINTERRATTLKHGPLHIVGTLLDLPATKHDFPSFSLDCSVVDIGTQILTISINGSFLEDGKKKRCFARTFTLIPAPADSKWPCVILNDQFYVRHFTQKKPKADILKIAQLAKETKLKINLCEECLAQNNWNYENALNDVRCLLANNQLPAESFDQ